MAEWLFEIFSEEIPSRMQQDGAQQFNELARVHLEEQGLTFENIRTFVTPRRLTLVVEGLPLETTEKLEERKGPNVEAPSAAIEGFLKSAGVQKEDCIVKETPKGSFLFVNKIHPGQPTPKILANISLSILEKFRWPKSMRWGSLDVTWVRPIRGLLCIFDGKVVPFSYANITSTNETKGHRFLSPEPFKISDFNDYEEKLRKHHVILDWQERRTLIEKEIGQVAGSLKPIEDKTLLDEVTGLVEWPVILKGKVDEQFMQLPPEVIITPMRVHQRYFPLIDNQGKLAPSFGLVSNIKSIDDNKKITIGNERVLRARLADAQFFWAQDQKQPLEQFNVALKKRLFHKSLGTIFDKVERLRKLSSYIAKSIHTEPKVVERAALLSKADLASQMVGEFPELQGTMGRYYAQNQGEPTEVYQAIEQHYWPKASGEAIPEKIPSLVLAIADRLDTLVGFFAVGITPSGSKDPFALRRASLGLISLALNPHFSLSIPEAIGWAYDTYPWDEMSVPNLLSKDAIISALWKFLLERFKFAMRDGQGSPYDHVDAVLSVAHESPIFSTLALRVQALDQLMDGDDGKNLLAAYKRASNILRIEEEKDKLKYGGDVLPDKLEAPEEKNLFESLSIKAPSIQELINNGNFIQAAQDLATLRPNVDQFFEKVVVNADADKLRKNRLHLLAFLRKTLHQVADFSKIES